MRFVRAAQAQDAPPHLIRYVAATIGAPDVAAIASSYATFGYSVVEEGTVDPALAISWGAPRNSGRRFIVLRPGTGENVFIRAVQTDAVPNFKAATTLGWNSIEFLTSAPERAQELIKGSGIEVLSVPKALFSFPTIVAMQTIGPAQEVIHFTGEIGTPEKPRLPPAPPNGDVGRLFIVVLAAADVATAVDWYASRFNMPKAPLRSDLVSVINKSQGLPADTRSDAAVLRMTDFGNSVEFWGMVGKAAVPRPRGFEQLPPGVAMATMTVRNLDAITGVTWLRPPAPRQGLIYNGKRAATCTGPAGELVELVED